MIGWLLWFSINCCHFWVEDMIKSWLFSFYKMTVASTTLIQKFLNFQGFFFFFFGCKGWRRRHFWYTFPWQQQELNLKTNLSYSQQFSVKLSKYQDFFSWWNKMMKNDGKKDVPNLLFKEQRCEIMDRIPAFCWQRSMWYRVRIVSGHVLCKKIVAFRPWVSHHQGIK